LRLSSLSHATSRERVGVIQVAFIQAIHEHNEYAKPLRDRLDPSPGAKAPSSPRKVGGERKRKAYGRKDDATRFLL
jgi:hypothetical protein